jgi:sulfonate transport system substrate-binding protein
MTDRNNTSRHFVATAEHHTPSVAGGTAVSALALASGGLHAQQGNGTAGGQRVLRVGHQKGWLSILKNRGTLEKRLTPLGVAVRWVEFNAGPVQLEALNVGSIDFGDVGEAPPIFAQAAGAPLVYAGATVARPGLEAVIVPKGSAIRSVADLKGKRIAYNKGSNVHYFLVKLLEKHGLKYGDVQSVFLAPPDARAAFEKGSVDAWVIWDPFLASAQKTLDARLLADARAWSTTVPTTSPRVTMRAAMPMCCASRSRKSPPSMPGPARTRAQQRQSCRRSWAWTPP